MRKDTVHLILFLAIMAGVFTGLFFVGRARGDEFTDRVKALEAKNAAKKPDPFSRGNHATAPNYTHWYQHGTGYGSKFVCDCGCIETGQCSCKNCCTPAKTRKIDNQPARADCGCSGRGDCTCPRESCDCTACKGMMATDPLIRASDGNLYPRSAWGPEMPSRASWGPLGGFNGQPAYQPVYSATRGRFFGGFRGGSGGCGPGGCH